MSGFSILNLFLIVLSFTVAVSEQCNPQDKRTLLEIKKELGNPANLSSWLPTTDCCDGTWVGVGCDKVHSKTTYRVNHLDLSELNLPKPCPIPPSVGNLPYLQFFYITFTDNIVGPIPHTMAKLTNLRSLYIRYTNVSGHIPYFLSQITTLQYIMISNSRLSGTLPAWLPSLPNLTGISFDGNHLTGTIPHSFGSFPSVFDTLTLSGNSLSGKIPATLAKLDLVTVHLQDNMLEGDASMLFGKRTRQIYLSNNRLAFDLGKVRLSKTIEGLQIDNNRIYGNLPRGLASLKDLIWFNVSSNYLCGEIPQGGKLQTFFASSYDHNNCLCGSPLPSCKSS